MTNYDILEIFSRLDREQIKRIGPYAKQVRRSQTNLSQADVVDSCGVSKSYVSKVEQGRLPMSYRLLCDMAAAMKVEPSALMPADLLEAAPTKGGELREESPVAYGPRKPRRFEQVTRGEVSPVPVLSFAKAASFAPSIDSIGAFLDQFGDEEEWAEAREGCFLVRVVGCSMLPDIPNGSLLYVNAGRFPGTGELVFAMLSDQEEPVVKYFSRRNNMVRLESLNKAVGVDFEIDLRREPGRLVYCFPVDDIRVKPRRRRL